MYERQSSHSKLNIYIHMDGHSDSGNCAPVCACTTYAVPGISTFSSATCTSDYLQQNVDDAAKNIMADIREIDTSVDSLLQKHSVVNSDPNKFSNELLSPVENIYEGTNIKTKDEKIFQAVNEALNTGSLTPLVKEELKCSIQSRRLKEGKSELQVGFSDPIKYELSPDEVVRVENRRVQNRVAAQRFRERQKGRAEDLQRKCNKLESHNTQLRHELKKLREEKDNLRKTLNEHLKICPYVSQTNFAKPR